MQGHGVWALLYMYRLQANKDRCSLYAEVLVTLWSQCTVYSDNCRLWATVLVNRCCPGWQLWGRAKNQVSSGASQALSDGLVKEKQQQQQQQLVWSIKEIYWRWPLDSFQSQFAYWMELIAWKESTRETAILTRSGIKCHLQLSSRPLYFGQQL